MADVLDKFHYGIYMMGTCHEDRINTMIASWVTQVSGDPEMVAVAVKASRASAQLLDLGKAFTLALLGKDQAGDMNAFKGEKTFGDGTVNGVPFKHAENGAPVPERCVGYVELTLADRLEIGNHLLYIGQVTNEVLVDGGPGLPAADLDGHRYRGK